MDDLSPNEAPTIGSETDSAVVVPESSSTLAPTSLISDQLKEQTGWHEVVDTGLVQNRITIAGFVLTLLVFTSTVFLAFIALAVQGQEPAKRVDYVLSAPWVYVNTILPVFLGFLLAISSIVLLLMSQQLHRGWIFALGEILLFLALAEFLAGGLSKIANVVMLSALYGSKSHPNIGYLIAVLTRVLPIPLWWTLLFVGPITRLSRLQVRRQAVIGYACATMLVLISSALSFELKRAELSGWWTFIKSFLKQLVQPLFW
jgi:hypothetical protein